MAQPIARPSDRWQVRDNVLIAEFAWPDFAAGLRFVNAIGFLAERKQHHPDIELGYTRVIVRLTSHDAGTITNRDQVLAAEIDRLMDASATWSG